MVGLAINSVLTGHSYVIPVRPLQMALKGKVVSESPACVGH